MSITIFTHVVSIYHLPPVIDHLTIEKLTFGVAAEFPRRGGPVSPRPNASNINQLVGYCGDGSTTRFSRDPESQQQMRDSYAANFTADAIDYRASRVALDRWSAILMANN